MGFVANRALIVLGLVIIVAVVLTQPIPLSETWNRIVFLGGMLCVAIGIIVRNRKRRARATGLSWRGRIVAITKVAVPAVAIISGFLLLCSDHPTIGLAILVIAGSVEGERNYMGKGLQDLSPPRGRKPLPRATYE